ncbi:MAG: DUF47 family protein [Bacteroidetes bacterium]|nr:DUF47 family protein [Bacteroidota bacterium]
MATGFLKYFLPKDKVFYTLFETASDNIELLARKFILVVQESDFNKRAILIKEMEDIEHKNDEISHQIFIELGRNFITPFDREDIHSLASALDDIADYIYGAGKKINFYRIDPLQDDGIQKSANAILEAVLAVKSAVAEIRNLKNTHKIVEFIIKINNIENQSDEIFDSCIEKLFDSDVDAKELIKRRELYQELELITDKCEDAGNVIESIIVKYA